MNIITKDGSYSTENFNQLEEALKTSSTNGRTLYLVRDSSGNIKKTAEKTQAISLESLNSLKEAISEKQKNLDKVKNKEERKILVKDYKLVKSAIAYQKSVLSSNFNSKASLFDSPYPFAGASASAATAPQIPFTTELDSITEETDSEEEIEALTLDVNPTQVEIFSLKPSIQKNPDQIKAIKEMPLQAQGRLRYLIFEQKKENPTSKKYLDLETQIDRMLKGVKAKSVSFEPDMGITNFSQTFPEKLSRYFLQIVHEEFYDEQDILEDDILEEVMPVLLSDENLLESSKGHINSIDTRIINSAVKSIMYEIEDLFMEFLAQTKKIIQTRINNNTLIDKANPQKYEEDIAFEILLQEVDKFKAQLSEKYPKEQYPIIHESFVKAADGVKGALVADDFKLLADEFMDDTTWS